ncbi:MAG: type 4a pilus biogenesis protein PilO, partial [Nitrospirota bacterium]
MNIFGTKVKRLSPKQETLLFVLVPVAMVFLFAYYLYIPMNASINDLEGKVEQNESEISKNQVMQRKLAQLRKADEVLQGELKAATQRLPGSAEEATLPDTLTGIIKDSGLKLKAIQPGAKTPGPGNLYVQEQMTVEASGGYHDIGKLFEKIDGMTMELAINDLAMQDAKINGIKMDIPLKFTVLAFSAGGGNK